MTDAQAHKEKSQAALASLGTALVLTSVKLAVGFYTNSLGILSEAVHSGFDLLAAALTFFAVRLAARPADSEHPYGHGKVENLAALAETALLLVTCGWIIGEAVERLFYNAAPVKPSLWGVGVMAMSIALDVHRVRLLRRVAKKHNSQALEADALHFSSDILSSAVVLVGVLIIWGAQFLPQDSTWLPYLHAADAVAALAVSVIVLHACYALSHKAVNALMDGGSDEMRERIEEAARSVRGVNHVHSVRMRNSGADIFVDLTVCVPPRLSVEGGHKVAHQVEESIQAALPKADVTVHVEPGQEADKDNPLLIMQNAAARHEVSIHGVQLLEKDAALHAEVHTEFPGSMTLAEAHHRVTAFEEDVVKLLPQTEIVSHLEPLGTTDMDAPCVLPCDTTELARLELVVEQVLLAVPGVSGCHRLNAYRLGSDREEPYVHLSFHCRMKGTVSVDDAHSASLRVEQDLRRHMPELGRIVLHMEPQE